MILTYICFLEHSITPRQFVDLAESEDLGFRPTRLVDDQVARGGTQFGPAAIQRVREATRSLWTTVEGDECSFERAGIAGWPAQVLIWRTKEWPSEDLVNAASCLPGFTSATVGDSGDVFWQSEDRSTNYEAHGRSWSHLPVLDEHPPGGGVRLDTSQNPGRRAPAPGMWLWAGSKMWFGPGSFRLVDRDRLLSLPVGTVIDRPDGVVVVELFSLDWELDAIRAVQRGFRDWMGYDQLEVQARELAGEMADPAMEIETQGCVHGGERRVVFWLDEADRLTPRSRAVRGRVRELDADGVVVWEAHIDPE